VTQVINTNLAPDDMWDPDKRIDATLANCGPEVTTASKVLLVGTFRQFLKDIKQFRGGEETPEEIIGAIEHLIANMVSEMVQNFVSLADEDKCKVLVTETLNESYTLAIAAIKMHHAALVARRGAH
jgi:hypothetical protein